MEYIFGPIRKEGRDFERLETIGERHTDLSGRVIIRREFPDRIIEDVFSITEHYDTKEDAEGNCYDYYLIEAHYRDTDRFTPQRHEIDRGITDAQDATCELSEELDERIADIENALCELTTEEE